jgi:hypothetical protein
MSGYGSQMVTITVEVCLRSDAQQAVNPAAIEAAVLRWLQSLGGGSYHEGELQIPLGVDPLIDAHVASARVTDLEPAQQQHPARRLLPWEVQWQVYVHSLDTDGPGSDDECDEDGVPSFQEWTLPSQVCGHGWEGMQAGSTHTHTHTSTMNVLDALHP